MNFPRRTLKKWLGSFDTSSEPKPIIIECEECGELCELAYTTGDCCKCFNETWMSDMPWCPTCEKREQEKERIRKQTIPLSEFI